MRNMAYRGLWGACLWAALLVSCEKPYSYDRDLAVTAREIRLTEYEGSTHVIVYSNGKWSASLTAAVTWARLEVIKSDGIGDLVFSYNENQGISRRVGIRLEKGAAVDTVMMIQTGSNTNPQLIFKDEIMTIGGQAGSYNAELVSNVMNSVELIEPSVVYYNWGEPSPAVPVGGDGWIRSCTIADNIAKLEVTSNNTGERRSADLVLRLNNDMDVDFSVTLRIRQNPL